MTLPRLSVWIPAIALIAGLGSCTTPEPAVDDACRTNGNVPGGQFLSERERAAVNRMNCYRRQTGLSLARVSRTAQDAVSGHRDYVLNPANIDIDLFFGDRNQLQFFQQSAESDEFTGANATNRLTEAGQVIYNNSRVWEEVSWRLETAADPGPSIEDTVDDLMREWGFREQILRRSWLEGGFAEIELDSAWLNAADACVTRARFFGCVNGEVPADRVMRVWYSLAMANEPPLERIFEPMVYPIPDQTGVPLYSPSQDLDTIATTGTATPTQIGYPITIYGNYVSQDQVFTGDANWYGTIVLARLSRVGDPYPLSVRTRVVYPGEAAQGRFPGGVTPRESVAIYPVFPLQPGTQYLLETDVWTRAGLYNIDYNFTTVGEDPGLGNSGTVGTGEYSPTGDPTGSTGDTGAGGTDETTEEEKKGNGY